jgi:hypothetical protein
MDYRRDCSVKREFEYAYSKSRALGIFKSNIPITPYVPTHRQPPSRCLDTKSAWQGIENILGDIIQRFDLGTDRCLEFGVEYGFSTVALSSYFKSVTGVDTFQGDRHTTILRDIYQETLTRLAPFDNIQLVRSDYRDFIKQDQGTYDLIHVDIIHTFADTHACGLWSAQHSNCTIFHDTESFAQVKQAVKEISRATGKSFYNYLESHGLGILV